MTYVPVGIVDAIASARQYLGGMDQDQIPQIDLAQQVDGPFVVTFTAHLPFPVCVPSQLGHFLSSGAPFLDESAHKDFPSGPVVNIRFFELGKPGLPRWQEGTHAALMSFYGFQLDEAPDIRFGEESFIERNQWVTLETPHAAADGENPIADPAFTFHRCLRMFNLFLQAAQLLTQDIRIRTISSRDLRPVVIIGAIQQGRPWQLLRLMLMHPDAQPEGLLTRDIPFTQDELNGALYAIATNKPYLRTAFWRARAQRAQRQTGDAADAIISFQVAAESMLFDTYRMLLVDEGLSSREITDILEGDIPFKSLLTTHLPARLGGQWNIALQGSAISEYWEKVYKIRNSIIHAGLQPHESSADDAQAAYWRLRDHVEDRLWAKRKTYPRTLLARVGKDQLAGRKGLTAELGRFIENAGNESRPYYWPSDLRQPPTTE